MQTGDTWRSKFRALGAALNESRYKIVFLFDEYQSLFQHNNYDDASEVAATLKDFTFDPESPNLGFIL